MESVVYDEEEGCGLYLQAVQGLRSRSREEAWDPQSLLSAILSPALPLSHTHTALDTRVGVRACVELFQRAIRVWPDLSLLLDTTLTCISSGLPASSRPAAAFTYARQRYSAITGEPLIPLPSTRLPAATSSVLLVGIGGATRSGKSTLATALTSLSMVREIVRLDSCYLPLPRIPRVAASRPYARDVEETTEGVQYNWETAAGIDVEQALALIDRARTRASHHCHRTGEPCVVLVESFVLHAPELERVRAELVGSLFLTIPKTLCHSRRQNSAPVSEHYFEACVWPEYVRQNAQVVGGEVLLLDGVASRAQLLSSAARFLLDGCVANAVQQFVATHNNASLLQRHARYLEGDE